VDLRRGDPVPLPARRGDAALAEARPPAAPALRRSTRDVPVGAPARRRPAAGRVAPAPRSAPLPHWRPLLLERLDALLGVLAHEDAGGEAHLVHERLLQGKEGALLRRLLARPDRERPVEADGRGQGARLLHDPIARYDAVHESDLVGALRAD